MDVDERLALKGQAEFLNQQLQGVQTALNNSQVNVGLDSVQNLFAKIITGQLQELGEVREAIEKGQALKEGWKNFLKVRQDSEPFFKECLALIEGALVRSTGLDNGLCRIADALLEDLSSRAVIPWGRFTILAEREYYGEMAQIIRLRFPEISIWNLPIAAHEFGHFIGPEMKQAVIDGTFFYPFQDKLQKIVDQQERAFLHEYFADLFATFTLGPAFACSCIFLRFDPMTAFNDTRDHPAPAKRFYVIRTTLEKMNLGPYLGIVTHLDSMWQQSLKVVWQREHLAQDFASQLGELFKMLYDLVKTELATIQYKDLPHAYKLSHILLTDTEAAYIIEPEHTLVDVLNAAWICRIENEDRDNKLVPRIGKRAVELCEEIILRKRQTK